MNHSLRVLLYGSMLALASTTCSGSGTDPEASDIVIVVSTTGGLVPRDWQVTLLGFAETVYVNRCAPPCPLGSTGSASLSDDEIEDIGVLFVEAGVRENRDVDYGLCPGCADQTHHVIEYRDSTGLSRLQGDGPNLPPAIREALRLLVWPLVVGPLPDGS
jgi:hypothetical protein